MDAKHTPGPFVADQNTAEIPFRVYSKNTQGNVGFFYAESDANLFAAAPETADERDRLKEINAEMLEALESLLEAVRQNIDGQPPTADQIFAKAGHTAVAAIAKATGQ